MPLCSETSHVHCLCLAGKEFVCQTFTLPIFLWIIFLSFEAQIPTLFFLARKGIEASIACLAASRWVHRTPIWTWVFCFFFFCPLVNLPYVNLINRPISRIQKDRGNLFLCNIINYIWLHRRKFQILDKSRICRTVNVHTILIFE